MVAVKSLVASVLFALLLAPAALADTYALRIDPEDQAWAAQALLRPGDFGHGWRGGSVPSEKPVGISCPDFDPKASDLVVTGQGSASFENARAGVEVHVDSQVFESATAVKTDFARMIQPPLTACLAYRLEKNTQIAEATAQPLRFPRIGSATAAYRVLTTVRSQGKRYKYVRDYVFFSNGRLEFSLIVVAPARYKENLAPFEAEIARLLVKRGSKTE